MRLISSMILAAALVVLGGPAAGQPAPQRNVIIVAGVGYARRAPDFVILTYDARGEARTAGAALAAAAKMRSELDEALHSLAGASAVAIRNASVSTSEVRGKSCKSDEDSFDDRPVLSTGDCAVIGFVTTLAVEARIWPANRAGDAASLVTQIGAKDVELSSWGLDKEELLSDAAAEAAVADARRQAAALARGGGVVLGEILQISDSSPGAGVEEIVVTASRRGSGGGAQVPAIPLDIAPTPVTRSAKATVTFAIGR